MNVKACLFGAVLGFLVALGVSCGGAKCGPANCGGCCDASNTCIARAASNTNAVCGTEGNACLDCAASGKTCDTSNYTCKATGTGGGAATGGGSGTGGGTATGGGTGTGGGAVDAGLMSNCNINSQNCNTGEACMFANASATVTRCSAGFCDLVDTGTCSANEKCTYGALLADGGIGRGCFPLDGHLTEGQDCSTDAGVDLCGPGLTCLGVTGGSQTCAKACYKEGDCGAGHCTELVPTFNRSEYAKFCIRSCNILTQDCGNAFEGCYQYNASSNVCLPTENAATGASCMSATACVAGDVCVSTSATEAFCKQVCNVDGGAPTCAPDAGTCGTFQGASFGICH